MFATAIRLSEDYLLFELSDLWLRNWGDKVSLEVSAKNRIIYIHSSPYQQDWMI